MARPEVPDDPQEGCSVTLVLGSAGAGKTYLLASWAAELARDGHCVGWVSLSRRDNDPAVLWSDVLGAVDDALRGPPRAAQEPTAASGVEVLVVPEGPDAHFAEAAVVALAALGHDIWLVLDDVHLVRDPRGLESLDMLLHWAPSNLHLVLGARSDPALRLSRLRMQGRLTEVRDRELRFSSAETRELLSMHGLDVAGAQLDRLHRLTEGWAAGVGLAAISLAAGRDVDGFLDDFGRDDGPMAAYLIDEVLGSLTPSVRDFLLDTCVPESLTVELAARLSQRDDAGTILHEAATNHVLVTVTHERGVPIYRYHVLLRSYLRARLRESSLRRSQLMHAQSAVWFAQRGDAIEAIEHAVASQDGALALGALHRYGLQLLLEGRAETLTTSLGGLPVEVRGQAVCRALAALASLELGHVAEAQAILDGLPDDAPDAGPEDLEGALLDAPTLEGATPLPVGRLIKAARASASRWGGRPDPALPERVHPVGPVAPNLRDLDLVEAVGAGLTLLVLGRLSDSRTTLEAALATARDLRYDFTVFVCVTGLAAQAAASGDLGAMRAQSEAAIDLGGRRGFSRSPRMLLPYATAADAAFQTYDLTRAAALVEAANALIEGRAEDVDGADRGGHRTTAVEDRSPRLQLVPQVLRTVKATAVAVAYELAEGEPVKQRALVSARGEELAGLAPDLATQSLLAYELYGQHRLAMRSGLLGLAEAVERQAAAHDVLTGDLQAMRSMRALGVGNDGDARALAAPVVSGTVVPLAVMALLMAQLVEVTLALRNDQHAVAHETLLAALDNAASGHFVRTVLEVSDEVVDALRESRGRFGRHEAFVEEALAVADSGAVTLRSKPLGPPPQLSPRELSLLRDLPSMLTVGEIALARSVSVNTVKTQLRSLFEKLEVNSRREAVVVGRREGLI